MSVSPFETASESKALTLRQRAFSGLELALAILIVVAHNVYHWIPNEVPILFVLAVASFRIREGNWGFRLYKRPDSWLRTLSLAAICTILLLAKDYAVDALETHFATAPQHVSSVITQAHDLRHLVGSLAIVWVFAAFGEEIGYRGYLLRRALDLFGQRGWGAALALLVASATFGLGHYYKGRSGMLDSAVSGLILGGAYLYSRRLWVSTLAHGVIDTLAVALSFLGWSS